MFKCKLKQQWISLCMLLLLLVKFIQQLNQLSTKAMATSSSRPSLRYVKVLYVGNGSKCYDGQYRFQYISNIIRLNGESVNGETLTLEALENGDEIKFLNMKMRGVVLQLKINLMQTIPTSQVERGKQDIQLKNILLRKKRKKVNFA